MGNIEIFQLMLTKFDTVLLNLPSKLPKMAKEIERKYLVVSQKYREIADSKAEIRQGYLSANPDATVRVRIYGDRGFLTVKSRNRGIERGEWEYEIPTADATAMLKLCQQKGLIEKTRYRVGRWEIDEFHGRLQGLNVAEIELTSADEVVAPLPSFIGREVSGDPRYYNSALSEADTPPSED